jgi:hypothetical protein
MAKLTDKKASVFYILTKRLLLQYKQDSFIPGKVGQQGQWKH